MPSEIHLIKVGMTMTEGTVAEWYVADGGAVTEGEPLYRLETEKVSMDVEAPSSGTVRHLVAPGITLAPVAVIGFLYAPGEEIPASLPTPGAAGATKAPAAQAVLPDSAAVPVSGPPGGRVSSSPGARRLATELGVPLDAVHGSGPGGRIVEADVRAAYAAALGSGTRSGSPPSK